MLRAPINGGSPVAAVATDPAPQVEIQYWKCLADALLVYYSTTIQLPRAMADALSAARAEKAQSNNSPTTAAATTASAATTAAAAATGNALGGDIGGGLTGGGAAAMGLGGGAGGGGGMMCLKDFDLEPEQRLGIVMSVVPKERRVALLQRLFYLTQGEPRASTPAVPALCHVVSLVPVRPRSRLLCS
jgi:hypothetical protein